MALSRGFGAIKKAKKEADERGRQMSANRTRDFFLQGDGATATVWFNGPSDEPVMALYHTVTLGNNQFRTELCGSVLDDHEGCVFCRAAAGGDKRVGKAKPMAVFNVFDTRWVHKKLNKEKTAAAGGKFERFDWRDCQGDPENDEPDRADKKACRYCRKGWDRARSGQKKTRFSVTAAGALDSQNDSAKKKCHCGGKLTLEGYKNGKKTVPDLDDVDNPDDWEPIYECRKCDDPAPRTIHMCPVEITRSGTKTNTQYNFGPKWDEMGDPPDYVQEAEVPDLEDVLIPMTADQMAEMLGIKNPFGSSKSSKKKKASDYDDDDDDDYDDEDPHDEDDDEDDDD